ncbi:MAG: substrate-binding domain-containing protein, partial [Kiritimatiellia bacterium]
IPLISVDRELEHAHADFVGTDDERIGEMAAEELIRLGHTRLGQIAGPDAVTTGRRRRRGFERAVEKAGLSCRTIISPKFDEGLEVIPDLLASPDRPTAVFAANDVLASQTYQVALQMNLHIPGDLSVIGCSNLSISRLLSPELSTFEHFPGKIGTEAAKLLLDRLDKKHNDSDLPVVPRRTLIMPEYIARGSTAAPHRT